MAALVPPEDRRLVACVAEATPRMLLGILLPRSCKGCLAGVRTLTLNGLCFSICDADALAARPVRLAQR
jgi:hypothetical protein